MSSSQDLHGKFRDEIIESQKMQSDILKWKLIAVAALASVSLGFGHKEIGGAADAAGAVKSLSSGSRWLLCLIPLMCAYVDLISIHYMLRIVTIGAYLKSIGDPYETVMFSLRGQTGRNPFVFESRALQGSSIVFNLTLVGIGFIMLAWNNDWDLQHKVGYIVTGLIGIGFSAYLIFAYPDLEKRIETSITIAAATSAANAATNSAGASTNAATATNAALATATPFAAALAMECTSATLAANDCAAAAVSANAAAAAINVAAGPVPGVTSGAAAAARAAALAAARAADATDALVTAVGAQPGVAAAVLAILAAEKVRARTAALAAAAAASTVER